MFIIHKNTVMSIGYTLNGSANPGRAFPYFALTHTHIKIYKRGIKKRPEINLA